MKAIHVLIALAAMSAAPWAAQAQSTEPEATQGATPPKPTSGTGGTDVGSTGTGTGDIGSTGTGTGDIGSTGTGTGDIGSTGTGTGDIGSTGTGTGTLSAAAPMPEVSLSSDVDWLRTPGTLEVTVTLAADPTVQMDESTSISVPLSSSSQACPVPETVDVGWSAASGGSAKVQVSCERAPGQKVTISSGEASLEFSTR